jgi:hypothetical protein
MEATSGLITPAALRNVRASVSFPYLLSLEPRLSDDPAPLSCLGIPTDSSEVALSHAIYFVPPWSKVGQYDG